MCMVIRKDYVEETDIEERRENKRGLAYLQIGSVEDAEEKKAR